MPAYSSPFHLECRASLNTREALINEDQLGLLRRPRSLAPWTFYDGYGSRQHVKQFGRRPEDLNVLPGNVPIAAKSFSEARDTQALLKSVRIGIDLLCSFCGVDLSKFPLDGQLPPLRKDESLDGQRTNLARVRAFAEQNPSIRQAAQRVSSSDTAPLMAGTATDVADQMQAWFTDDAADGFNLMFQVMPQDWMNFTRFVVSDL